MLINPKTWPELPYKEFNSTAYLLHRIVQVMGKLKLLTPFEPEWANVILNITINGLTTGLIPYNDTAFSVELNLNEHEINCLTLDGRCKKIKLLDISVADLVAHLLQNLKSLGIDVAINLKPQEIPNAIVFDKDKAIRHYNHTLAQSWWVILVKSFFVLQRYHALFLGKTQPIGLMWGTFDLRDVRFKNAKIATPTSGPNAGYLRRNAMDSAQIEAGWWSGNEMYPKAAYYSFTFPEPKNIAQAKILPQEAHWDDTLKLFVLDYEQVKNSKNPAEYLLQFFESTYLAGAEQARWDKKLIGSGKPV